MKETAVKNNMKRYDAYKDSGVEWLGEIPKHWEATKVKNVFKLIVEPAHANNDFELLSVYTDIGVKPRRELKERGNKASTTDGYWLVKKGDVIVNKLLAWMGAIGVSNYDGVTSPAYDILRAKVKIESNFYHYLFRNSACISELKKHSRGIMDMRLRLYFDKFGDVVIPYPNYEEQKIIVDFLDDKTNKIDEAIAIKEQQINLLKERKQILIHKAVTQGLNPNVKLKDSGVEWIGEIPVGWEVKRLKHCLNINNGSDYKHIQTDEGYPVIGSGGQFAYASEYMFDGEVVFLGRKGTIDKPLYFKGKFWAVDTMFYANSKNGNIVKFLYYLATTLPFSYYSTATALPSMTQGDLNNHPIPRPPIDEQKKIVEYIENGTNKIETAISLKQQEIDKLKEYKSSLINGVVTGKVRVC